MTKLIDSPSAEPTEAKAPKQKPLFAHASELVATMSAPRWVVKGLLEADTTGMIYGAPGDGKSFLAFDLACCVATGTPWHGRKVAQGPVLYIAGEGQGGIKRRLAAWEKANNVELSGAPLIVTVSACDLYDADSAKNLAAEAKKALGDVVPVLVIIDTVARSMGAGNENDSADAGRYVASVDAALREPFGAHVMMVHHSGKDAARGARGSTVFKSSVEQQFELQKDGKSKRRLVCHKMKDGIEPEAFHFELETVQLGTFKDQFGDVEAVTSAVVRPLDAADIPVATARSARGADIEELDDVTPEEIATYITLNQGWPGYGALVGRFGCGRSVISRGLEQAVRLGLLVKAGRFYRAPGPI